MSLILDALRKMEQERRARRQSETDIRPDVLSYRGVAQKPSRSSHLLPVAITTVVIVALVTGWFLMQGEKTAPDVPGRQTPGQAAVVQSAMPPSQPPAAVTPPQPQPFQAPVSQQQPLQPTPMVRESSPPVSEAAAAGISISGIAWQEERSMRRAVINGVLLGEGAEVSGARVVEIRENRVRFSRNGQTFEVVYSSGINQLGD